MGIVGLPDAAVRESAERVRTAVRNAGFKWPRSRLTVNLAPAHLRKEGPVYDLPIAAGVLACSGRLRSEADGVALRWAKDVLADVTGYVDGEPWKAPCAPAAARQLVQQFEYMLRDITTEDAQAAGEAAERAAQVILEDVRKKI